EEVEQRDGRGAHASRYQGLDQRKHGRTDHVARGDRDPQQAESGIHTGHKISTPHDERRRKVDKSKNDELQTFVIAGEARRELPAKVRTHEAAYAIDNRKPRTEFSRTEPVASNEKTRLPLENTETEKTLNGETDDQMAKGRRSQERRRNLLYRMWFRR